MLTYVKRTWREPLLTGKVDSKSSIIRAKSERTWLRWLLEAKLRSARTDLINGLIFRACCVYSNGTVQLSVASRYHEAEEGRALTWLLRITMFRIITMGQRLVIIRNK
jgi:hypothetical protein